MMNEPTANRATLDTLLVQCFQSYRNGLRRQAQSCPTAPSQNVDLIKLLCIIDRIPLKERLYLRHINTVCKKGLVAARRGYLDEARAHYQQTKEYFHHLEGGSRLARLFAVSTYEAGMAYFDFRLGHIEQARERLDHAMDADLELEQSDLPMMQMHRIQQGHNLARMARQMGQRQMALELTGLLLAYMGKKIETLPYHREWRPKSLRLLPRGLLRPMIYQLAGDAASLIVTGDAPAEEWHILIEASRLCGEQELVILPQVRYSLQAQRDRLAGLPESYLMNLGRFFGFGIRYCHLLWYSIMLGFLDFCREINTNISRRVGEAIVRDSAKWKGLSLPLRLRFNSDQLTRGNAPPV
jgi:tetratricopeptide (TPR) repeat protein